MNNQVVFNKFAVKSGDNWVADSDLLKRTAGYKVTAEDWNSIFLILASQADNNASAVKELADSASSQSDTITAHSESISSLNARVQTLETESAEDVRSIKVGNNTLSATDNTLELPVDVDTMQSPDNLPTVRAVKDYVEHFSMDSAGFVIDAELSDTSKHALQNKKVKEAVDDLQAQVTSNLNSIVQNSKEVTNRFTEVDSAISSVSATAMTNLDKAEENINQNISNLQNALNAEVTNCKSAVTSLGNSVSENTNQINNIMNANSDSGWLELDVSKIHTTNVANDSTINSASVRRVGKRVELYVSFQLESNQNGEFNLMFGNAIKSKFNGQDLRPSSDADKFDSFMYVKQLNGNKALSYAYLYYYDGELGVNIIPLETLSELATCILHIGWFCN